MDWWIIGSVVVIVLAAALAHLLPDEPPVHPDNSYDL